MKNGFYMGYDASKQNEQEIFRQARLLLDRGFYSAGYNTIRLGDARRFADPAALTRALRGVGFQLDVEIPCTMEPEEAYALVKEWEPAMITLTETADHAKAEKMAEGFQGLRVAVCVENEALAWAGETTDIAVLNALTDTADFFDITRHQLDSCRNEDVDTARSVANLRAAAMKNGAVYQVGNLPLRFDAYRNEAIFLNMCMLGCPLVLSDDLEQMPAASAALVCNEKLLHVARLGLGRVARYYDPWHSLLVKAESEKTAYAMILNRCHGDQPTNILPADLGWSSRFQVRSWPCDEMIGANLETFEAHVETSDHPQTPCCKLYQLRAL